MLKDQDHTENHPACPDCRGRDTDFWAMTTNGDVYFCRDCDEPFYHTPPPPPRPPRFAIDWHGLATLMVVGMAALVIVMLKLPAPK